MTFTVGLNYPDIDYCVLEYKWKIDILKLILLRMNWAYLRCNIFNNIFHYPKAIHINRLVNS